MKAARFHVLPTRDSKAHSLACDCACKPELIEDGQIVVHNSFDGREGWERVGMPDPEKKWTAVEA